MPELIQLIQDLGGTLGALGASFWYIKYQTDQHTKREQVWLDKDTQSDLRIAEQGKQLAELQRESHTQLLNVLSGVNTTLKEMTIAISKLETRLEK